MPHSLVRASPRGFVWRQQTIVWRQQTIVWRQQTIVWWEQTIVWRQQTISKQKPNRAIDFIISANTQQIRLNIKRPSDNKGQTGANRISNPTQFGRCELQTTCGPTDIDTC
ncbi:hypothetical protein [Alloprevotella tannerae]